MNLFQRLRAGIIGSNANPPKNAPIIDGSLPGENATDLRTLAQLHQQADAHIAAGEYPQAEAILLRLLTLEKTTTFDDDPASLERCAVYADRGKSHGATRAELGLLRLYAKSGQNEQAKGYCDAIVERYRTVDDPTGLAWFLSGHTVPLYRRLGLLEEAATLQQEVIAWEAPRSEEKYSQYTACLNVLAEIYEAMERFADAVQIYQRILAICEQKYDPNARIFMDAFSAGVAMSYNPTEQARLQAFANYQRCLTRAQQQTPKPPAT